MKKYVAMAFMAIALSTVVYGVKQSQNSDDKCICNQTEICTCITDCDCSSCGS